MSPAGRLYVARLPPEITEDELRSSIQQCTGVPVGNVILRPKYAFIDISDEMPPDKAAQLLNGYEVMGSQLLVELARSKKGTVVHASNIPEEVQWDKFLQLVSGFGNFQQCDKVAEKANNYAAMITFETPEEAQLIQSKLNRYEIRPNVFLRAEVEGSRAGRSLRSPGNLPLRILVPSEMVGAVIGKGGAAIRRITQQSRARVDVHRKENAGCPEKVVTIFGTPDSCSTACQKIMELMHEEAGNTNKGDIPLKILAHNNLIGRIIGKRGNTIKSIMEQTETKISVSNAHDAFGVERTITIRGNPDNAGQAERLISTKLRQSYANDMIFPHHPMPSMYQQMPPMGGIMPVISPYGPEQTKETVVVVVPSASVGAIIGTGGAAVREMIRSSGATIKVANPVKDEEESSERRVSIIGTPDSQWKAQYLLFRKVSFEGFQGPRELKVELQIPSNQVGRIIGKRGRTVREVQRVTHAMIRFPVERGEEETTSVHIVGDFYSVQAAQRHIKSLMNPRRAC